MEPIYFSTATPGANRDGLRAYFLLGVPVATVVGALGGAAVGAMMKRPLAGPVVTGAVALGAYALAWPALLVASWGKQYHPESEPAGGA